MGRVFMYLACVWTNESEAEMIMLGLVLREAYGLVDFSYFLDEPRLGITCCLQEPSLQLTWSEAWSTMSYRPPV